jgi:DNA helicase-2/ATP-dependent DNA helicase PcrA
MRTLYLTHAETRRLHGSDTYNRPSRFLLEIPADLIAEVRMGGAIQRPYGGDRGHMVLSEDLEGALRMGQRVLHAKFGEGVVLQAEGAGERARVQVNFAEAGSKWLMMGYANLQALD